MAAVQQYRLDMLAALKPLTSSTQNGAFLSACVQHWSVCGAMIVACPSRFCWRLLARADVPEDPPTPLSLRAPPLSDALAAIRTSRRCGRANWSQIRPCRRPFSRGLTAPARPRTWSSTVRKESGAAAVVCSASLGNERVFALTLPVSSCLRAMRVQDRTGRTRTALAFPMSAASQTSRRTTREERKLDATKP